MEEYNDLVFLSVAADVGGAEAARPYHDKAGASFTTVVDAENSLGRLMGYKIIPNGFFIDEQGVLQGKWIGFSVDKPECLAVVDEFRAGTMKPFVREPAGPIGSPGVAPGPVAAVGRLSPIEQELYDVRVRLGAALEALGHRDEAVAEWHKALMMDRENFVLRKQIWMLKYPDKFYPVIDFDWQKHQLAHERLEEENTRDNLCGPYGCALTPRY